MLRRDMEFGKRSPSGLFLLAVSVHGPSDVNLTKWFVNMASV